MCARPPARYCPARRPSTRGWHAPLLKPALRHVVFAGTSASSMLTTTSTAECALRRVSVARAPATTPFLQCGVASQSASFREDLVATTRAQLRSAEYRATSHDPNLYGRICLLSEP